MIASSVCSLYSFFATRRTFLIFFTCLYFAGCLFLLSRLELAEDISVFIPDSSPELVRSFDLLRQAPFVQSLAITIADGDDLTSTARQLAARLEKNGSYTVLSTIESSPRAFLEFFYRLLPSLLTEDAYNDLGNRISEKSIRSSMEKAVKAISGFGGIVRASLVAKDPIGMAELVGQHLGTRNIQSAIKFSNGLLVNDNGDHALMLARPVDAFTSASNAPALMHEFREAVADLSETAVVSATGGLIHTEANTAIISSDLMQVLPLAFVMLFLTFLFMFRNRQGLFVFLVPVVAIASATAGASLLVTSLSGIALGFGSVLLGITDDYPIHIYCATQSGSSVLKALQEVLTPLLAGSCSAFMAFGVFLFSALPVARQIALFATIGICSAVFFSLVVLPHVLRPGMVSLSTAEMYSDQIKQNYSVRVRWKWLTLIWAAAGLLLWAGISNSSFDGDIRNLSYVSEHTKEAELRHREVWGNMARGGMVVATGTTLEEALIQNDTVWDIIQNYHPEELTSTSIAPFLPSQTKQVAGNERWRSFWELHRDNAIKIIQKDAKDLGFNPTAFEPFFALIENPQQPVTAADMVNTDFGLLYKLLVREQDDSTLVYTLLETETLPHGLVDQIAKLGAIFVSGETFRHSLSAITQQEMIKNCLLALALIAGISLVTFHSWSKTALTLLPLGMSLAVIMSIFAFFDVKMTLFHAVAFPLIMMLGLDYGIFVVAYARQGAGSVAYRGIFISAFTTIAGFGCLIFARHPALHSLGVTATIGMVMSAVASVYLLPRLLVVEEE